MPLTLPTDTEHANYATRQYELFNKPIAKGIDRTKMTIFAVSAGIWFPLVALLGVSPFWRLGPSIYLIPVAAFVILGTRTDNSGRMAMVEWYDRIRYRLPGRRRIVTDPLVSADAHSRVAIELVLAAEIAHTLPGQQE
ncbi:hypothetical protein M8C13_07385 [Crossiella sp. SN42]|uniref:hypothetical protein n=1 Tax=Crossiella sp. SN42 TaxID=2944808 RepID=UPI00207C97E3|nr:hypothetical protein [Crossiella sp. SN42]MCO1575580.1 hypothetical protein [Crossiella sp. SN42]